MTRLLNVQQMFNGLAEDRKKFKQHTVEVGKKPEAFHE